MRNKKRSRKIALVLVCILIPIGAFGFGYFLNHYTKDKAVSKALTVEGSIGGTMVDTAVSVEKIVPGDTINQSIQINSTSTAPSLIRVKIEPEWTGKLSNENIELIYEDDVVSKTIKNGENGYWYECSDGYLYYMDNVTTKENIKLVKGLKFIGGTDDENANKYQGKELKINVTMDIIQSKHAPFETKWDVKDEELKNALTQLCSQAEKQVE